MVGFNPDRRGWGFGGGRLLPIMESPSLYALLGATDGGDGITTFALPDLNAGERRFAICLRRAITLTSR